MKAYVLQDPKTLEFFVTRDVVGDITTSNIQEACVYTNKMMDPRRVDMPQYLIKEVEVKIIGLKNLNCPRCVTTLTKKKGHGEGVSWCEECQTSWYIIECKQHRKKDETK